MSWLNVLQRFSSSANVSKTNGKSEKAGQAGTPVSHAQEFEQRKERAGLLVTEELDKAIERCKAKVKRISDDCRRRNRRYRDIEFDIEGDRNRCLYGLNDMDESMSPADARRVKSIFEKPTFFVNGASRNTIQGALGNCWFLSALATVGTMPGLINKICVARDEQVGVYGFIFYMDSGWVDVVVDDLLYSKIPRWEELTNEQRGMYQQSKEIYEQVARKGSKSLYFSSSGAENETWVPLIEKAYAKLHGDYKALDGGLAEEAIEDLTGGISSRCSPADILDEDEFWENELLAVNHDRLFGCYSLDISVNGFEVNGLVPGHAYSIIRAVEVNGKRFVKIRNPWGKTEWTGRWSDGSREWTKEWLEALPELEHSFGNDGEFLMEYKDFLTTWTMIGRTRLFDSSWALSSQWLNVTSRPYPCAWSYGDVSFTISVTEHTPSVIVLSRNNKRHFEQLDGPYAWSLDFTLFRKGEDEPLGSSGHDMYCTRSVTMEIDLEPGEYVVHVRLDRYFDKPKSFWNEGLGNWNERRLARKWAMAALSASIAANFDSKRYENALPVPSELFTGRDLTEIELSSYTALAKSKTLPTLLISADGISTNGAQATVVDEGTPAEKIETPEGTKLAENTGAEPSPMERGNPNNNAGKAGDEKLTDDAQSPYTSAISSPVDAPDGVPSNVSNNDTEKLPSVVTSEAVHIQTTIVTVGLDNGARGAPSSPLAASPRPISPSSPTPVKAEPPVTHPARCDGCGMHPIEGARYHCLDSDCPDYDLCTKCMNAGVHPKEHRMLLMNTPDDEGHLQAANGEEYHDDITLGLRVYTKRNAPATVKGQLRHGKVLRWAKEARPVAAT